MPPSRAVLEFVNKLGTARAAELREYVVQLASACTPAAMTAAFGGMYSLEEGVLADVAAPASWDFVAAPAKSLPGQVRPCLSACVPVCLPARRPHAHTPARRPRACRTPS